EIGAADIQSPQGLEYFVPGSALAKDQQVEIPVVEVQVETEGDLGDGTSQKFPVIIGKGPVPVDVLPTEVPRSGIGLYGLSRGIDMGVDLRLVLEDAIGDKAIEGIDRFPDLRPGYGEGTGL